MCVGGCGAQPWNRFVSFVRVHARSGCLVELDLKSSDQPFPFSLLGPGSFPFSFWARRVLPFPYPHSPNLLSKFSRAYRYMSEVGVLNRQSFRSVRACVYAAWLPSGISKAGGRPFPFPSGSRELSPSPFGGDELSRFLSPHPPNILSNFSWAYRCIYIYIYIYIYIFVTF